MDSMLYGAKISIEGVVTPKLVRRVPLFLAEISREALDFGNLERSFSRSGRGESGSGTEWKRSRYKSEDDEYEDSSSTSSGGTPSMRGVTAPSNWAGSPMPGEDDALGDAYTPSGTRPRVRGALASDSMMRSHATKVYDGSGAAYNSSSPSRTHSRREVSLPSVSGDATKGYDGGGGLGIAVDDKGPSGTQPRRGVSPPSSSETALKGNDGDPGVAHHFTVPSATRPRGGVSLPSVSEAALKGNDGGGMSEGIGNDRFLSGDFTETSTTAGHSRRGAVTMGDLSSRKASRRLWEETPKRDSSTSQLGSRTAARVASSLTHFTIGTGPHLAHTIPTAEIPKFVWNEGQEEKNNVASVLGLVGGILQVH